MSENIAVQLAGAAESALAELCRVTLWDNDARGYQEPADVDAVTSTLATIAHSMTQAAQQAARWLNRQEVHVGFDAGGSPRDLPEAIAALWAAADQARLTAEAFGDAAQRTSHLTGIDPGEAQS